MSFLLYWSLIFPVPFRVLARSICGVFVRVVVRDRDLTRGGILPTIVPWRGRDALSLRVGLLMDGVCCGFVTVGFPAPAAGLFSLGGPCLLQSFLLWLSLPSSHHHSPAITSTAAGPAWGFPSTTACALPTELA